MNMGYTEAQKRANIKYLAEKTDDIRVHAPKGTRDIWKEAARRRGQSMAQFVIETVNTRIEKESAADAAILGQVMTALAEAQSRPYTVVFRIKSISPADGESAFSEPSSKVLEADSEADARVAFFDYLVSQMPGWEIVSRDAMTLVMGDDDGSQEVCEIVSVE